MESSRPQLSGTLWPLALAAMLGVILWAFWCLLGYRFSPETYFTSPVAVFAQLPTLLQVRKPDEDKYEPQQQGDGETGHELFVSHDGQNGGRDRTRTCDLSGVIRTF